MLVDTHQIVIDGWHAFAAERGRTLSDQEIVERMFGRRTVDILIEMFGMDPADAAELATHSMDDKRAQVEATGVLLAAVPGAPEFVRATIRAGIPCAVVSSASGGNIQLAFEHIGLAGVIDVVIAHDHVEHGKPAPDPYLAGAAALGFTAGECVVFEDTAPGIESAHAAGALCVGVASLGMPEMVASADLVIADFTGLEPDELISRLDAHAQRAAHRGARSRDMSTAVGGGERPS